MLAHSSLGLLSCSFISNGIVRAACLLGEVQLLWIEDIAIKKNVWPTDVIEYNINVYL